MLRKLEWEIFLNCLPYFSKILFFSVLPTRTTRYRKAYFRSDKSRWPWRKKIVITVCVFAGSRKAPRKSHHEFNEKRQILKGRRGDWEKRGLLPGCLLVCQPGLGSARPGHNCLQKVYARSDSVHQKCCSSSVSESLLSLYSPSIIVASQSAEIAFRLNFRHKTPNCTIKKFVAHQ